MKSINPTQEHLISCYKNTALYIVHKNIVEELTKLLRINKSSIMATNEFKCVVTKNTQEVLYSKLTIKAQNNSDIEDANLLAQIVSLIKEAFSAINLKVNINTKFTANNRNELLVSITDALFDLRTILTFYNIADIYVGYAKITN